MVAALSVYLVVLFAAALYASPDLPASVLTLAPEGRRAEVGEILANPTFMRVLDFEAPADLRVYTYLLDHPDLNAALGRALGIAPYRVVRIGPRQYRGDDGSGNVGTIEVFSAEGHERAFMERGVSPGWWFGEIRGRVVAHLVFTAEGESVRANVTLWARIDHGVVDRLLRLLEPMIGGFLDWKLREQLTVPFRVAEVAAQHAAQFCPLLGALSWESPDERQALAGLAGCWRVEG